MIASMQEKTHALEAKLYELEGHINMTQTLNSHLQNIVDARRSCLVINSMAKPGHEEGADNSDDVRQVIETLERECGINQDVIKNNLDKKHSILCPYGYGKQLRIVKLTVESFKETVFRKHKYRRNSYIQRQKRSGKPVQIKVKLQPSLTRHQIGLPKFANSQFEGAKTIKFAYADIHGAQKAMLNNQ